ncbi:chemotaxis protein CheW, partial [bacterium]|nr:chemotaxis protein CheW [bacterium]
SDDGKGISTVAIKRKAIEKGMKSESELNQMNEKQLYSLIFQPGFSTADKISDVSGRGVGMDVVKNAIEKVGGSIELKSIQGKGTTVHLRMPLTLAIIPCLIVRVDGFRYAIPQINLEELICLYDDDVRTKIECAGNFEIYRLRNKLLPLVRLSEVLDRKTPFNDITVSEITEKYRLEQKKKYDEFTENDQNKEQNVLRQSLNFAVVKVGSNRFGLIIDEIEGTEEIVIKPLHSSMKKLICFSGATVMGDGKVVLILNIDGIARFARIAFSSYLKKYEDIQKVQSIGKLETILLFESGKNEHFAIPLPFVRRIERILMSDIDIIGDKEYIIIDGRSTRILRLEQVLDVSPCIENKEMSVILPKNIEPQIGILISNVINIEKTHINMSDSGYIETGVVGTSIINAHTTLLLELYSLIEKAESSWFREKRELKMTNPEQINILLIESDPFYKKLLVAYLKPENYDLTIVANGQEALDQLKLKKTHLIITNIHMPIMNGWEFVANIRQQPEYSKIPVIGLDDLDTTTIQDREKARKLEFKGFELKIDRENLIKKISEILSSTNKFEKILNNE